MLFCGGMGMWLLDYPYDGRWRAMDTFKDKQKLDEPWTMGRAPWRVRENGARRAGAASAMGA